MINIGTDIDPKYIDIALPDALPSDESFAGYVDAARNEDELLFGSSWPADVPVMEPREWKDYLIALKENYGRVDVARLFLNPYNDQSPESSCVLNATECALRNRRNRALGWQFEMKWSPMWAYQFICSHRHSGSYTVDALNFLLNVGMLPEKSSAKSSSERLTLCHNRSIQLCEHSYHQNTPYKGRRKYEEGKRTARWFKAKEFVRLENRYQFGTACLLGWGVVNGRRGHSIFHAGLLLREGKRGNNPRDYVSMYLDSYDKDRGDGGYLYDSYDSWATSGAWAVRTIYLPSNPLYPCGVDTKEVSLEDYYDLFPAVDRDYVQHLFDLGPTAAQPAAVEDIPTIAW